MPAGVCPRCVSIRLASLDVSLDTTHVDIRTGVLVCKGVGGTDVCGRGPRLTPGGCDTRRYGGVSALDDDTAEARSARDPTVARKRESCIPWERWLGSCVRPCRGSLRM